MSLATFSRGAGLLRPFMTELCQAPAPRFFELSPMDSRPWSWPGDMLGFQLGKTDHHCGILLGGGRFVHAITRLGATISNLSDPTWGSRLTIYWRPLE
jgi:hypothetical protein